MRRPTSARRSRLSVTAAVGRERGAMRPRPRPTHGVASRPRPRPPASARRGLAPFGRIVISPRRQSPLSCSSSQPETALDRRADGCHLTTIPSAPTLRTRGSRVEASTPRPTRRGRTEVCRAARMAHRVAGPQGPRLGQDVLPAQRPGVSLRRVLHHGRLGYPAPPGGPRPTPQTRGGRLRATGVGASWRSGGLSRDPL